MGGVTLKLLGFALKLALEFIIGDAMLMKGVYYSEEEIVTATIFFLSFSSTSVFTTFFF